MFYIRRQVCVEVNDGIEEMRKRWNQLEEKKRGFKWNNWKREGVGIRLMGGRK